MLNGFLRPRGDPLANLGLLNSLLLHLSCIGTTIVDTAAAPFLALRTGTVEMDQIVVIIQHIGRHTYFWKCIRTYLDASFCSDSSLIATTPFSVP